MGYNPNCTHIVIFCYTPYSSGKFLINSLGLSQDCYLQDINCVRLQRKNEFSPQDKLNFLLDRLSKVGDKWDDLGIGCQQLFGHPRATNSFYPEIYNISHDDNKFFFVITHNPCYEPGPTLDEYLTIWPKAKVVYLRKPNSFIKWRLGMPEDFEPTSEFRFPQEFTDISDQLLVKMDNLYVWETEWFRNQYTFIEELKKLYLHFGLTDFNKELIQIFYDRYMEKLLELRIKNLDLPIRDRCW